MYLLDRIDEAIKGLSDLRDEIAATSTDQAAPPAAAAVQDAHLEEPEPAAGGYDNTLPEKCPGCGKTFAEATVCDNGHPPIATQPTEAVLAGAEPQTSAGEGAQASPPSPDAAAPPAGSDASSSSSSASTTDGAAGPTSPPAWPS